MSFIINSMVKKRFINSGVVVMVYLVVILSWWFSNDGTDGSGDDVVVPS